MTQLFAWTDGACSGNPGPGGWGVLMRAMDGVQIIKERELSGGEADTTNNRMELMAAISALETLSRVSEITVVTDSTYVKNGVTQWIHGWKRNGWKNSQKKPVKNAALIKAIDAELSKRAGSVKFVWVKGHAGHRWNEICDALSKEAASSKNLPPDEGYEG